MAFSAVVCALLLNGCQVYPQPAKKSLHELYCEAVAASQSAVGSTSAPPEILIPPHQFAPGEFVHPVPPASTEPLTTPPVALPPVEFEPIIPRELQTHIIAPGTDTAGWKTSASANQSSPVRQVAWSGDPAELITEYLEDTDVRQALQAIATQANVTLIIDEQVNGLVTATIEDKPFESALRSILLPLGLVYEKVSETEYLVGIPDPETALFSRLSRQISFQPMHVKPSELVALISEQNQKYLRAIDNRNYVLIEAPTEIANSIESKLRGFDEPIPQVELEAIVCVIAPDRGFRSGLDWGHAVTLNGSELLRLGMQGLAFSGVGSGAGLTDAFTNFAVTSTFVRLLAQEGYLSIRAAPRVTARDGDQAKISITRESFFSTQPLTDNAFFRQDIQQVDAGISLDITPIVRGDNITMKIEKAEVSEDIRTAQINTDITENPFPQINRRTVSTTVHVKDGETIVIGGLVQRQTVDRIAKVPVLGDLPGIGRAFQTVEQTEQDAEVVIFISPRLVPACP